MARLLQAYHISINPSSLSLSNITSFFIFLAGVTGTLSIIMLLCTTYKHTKISKASQPSSPPPQRENKFLSHLSSKALVVVKMVSWKKVEEEEEEEEDDVDDQAVWRKAIIMGDKCRPPDFSGQILYDSQGNPLPEPPARSHRRHEMF